jgi:hypothetical protein
MRLFLRNLEGPIELPTSPRFVFEGGRVQWLAKPVDEDTEDCGPQPREFASNFGQDFGAGKDQPDELLEMD